MRQFTITPAAGKRLIAKALAEHPHVKTVLASGTLVVVAGTTNGYVAEEILGTIGEAQGFDRRRFFRGITLPPSGELTETGRLPDESRFPGDVVVTGGKWLKGKTIFDVVDDLKEGDLVLKGANAVNLAAGQAAVYIGHPRAGTVGAAMTAVVGRRVRLMVPVGVEKRTDANLQALALRLNAPGAEGPRLLPVPGEVFTELDAIRTMTGASACVAAGGGVGGAEGCVWLAVDGRPRQTEAAEALLASVANEPPFAL
jgi:hypothetical protein